MPIKEKQVGRAQGRDSLVAMNPARKIEFSEAAKNPKIENAMKEIKIEGLKNCPSCKNAAQFVANSRGYFQVRCAACGLRTRWSRKIEAVLNWQNERELFTWKKNNATCINQKSVV